ncbi:MAG: hypothetical protein ACTSQ4_11465 [Candidatus Heimdallarchaeaceae archaeon]
MFGQKSPITVRFDKKHIYIETIHPSYKPTSNKIRWKDIVRVGYTSIPLTNSKFLFLFFNKHQARISPFDANGGEELWEEIKRRDKFREDSASLEAAAFANSPQIAGPLAMKCWPPVEEEEKGEGKDWLNLNDPKMKSIKESMSQMF